MEKTGKTSRYKMVDYLIVGVFQLPFRTTFHDGVPFERRSWHDACPVSGARSHFGGRVSVMHDVVDCKFSKKGSTTSAHGLSLPPDSLIEGVDLPSLVLVEKLPVSAGLVEYAHVECGIIGE